MLFLAQNSIPYYYHLSKQNGMPTEVVYDVFTKIEKVLFGFLQNKVYSDMMGKIIRIMR